MRRRLAAAALLLAVSSTACAASDQTGAGERAMPRCEPGQRVAIVAQSVPAAAYVPCVRELAPGWTFESLEVHAGATTMALRSDRADTDAEVALTPGCDVGDATPIAPSDEGVRTYQLVRSVGPRYAGSFLDVFAGGCVTTSYDFERGPHLGLVTELRAIVDLYSRRELRQGLDDDLGLSLDP